MTNAFFNLGAGNFFQDWSANGLIAAANDWSGVPSIVGYNGNTGGNAAGTDLRTLTAAAGLGAVNVIANTTPASTTGGVGDMDALADRVVALQGSGTARIPSLVLYLDATGRQNLHLELDVRDVDSSGDNSVQQFNIQYRIGDSANWTNLAGSYIADASVGGGVQSMHLSIDLPAELNGQSQVELRFMTADASGSDEWLGVDNISVTSQAQGGGGANITIDNVSMAEGNSGDTVMTFTVTRSDNSGAFSVDYGTSGGNASAGTDYDTASGTLTFTAGGSLSQTISVIVHGDIAVETDETFNVVLSNVANSSGTASIQTGTGVGTILNDDAGPPSVTISDVTVAESNSGTITATFTVTRTGGPGAFTVDFATADGTASAGSDYVANTGTLSFGAGVNTQTVSVTVNGDTAFETNETFFVNLSNPTGGATIADAQGQGTITNDDITPPAIQPWINEFHYDNNGGDTGEFIEIAGLAGIDLTGYSLVLYNGNGGVTYNTLALSGVIPNQANGFGVVSFAYAPNGIQNGGTAPEPDAIALVGPGGVIEFISYEGVMTATNGPAAGMISVDVGVFEPGTASSTSIARVGDGVSGPDFTWVVAGDDTPAAVNSGQTFGTPSPRVRVADVSVTEGDSGTKVMTFTVTRSGTADAFTVDFSTADGTASAGSDYVATSGTLSFANGVNSQTVSVTLNGDTVTEGNETLFLNLANPTGGAVITDAQGRGTILNDDLAIVKIYEIQGASHTSPYLGQHIKTEGVVTAVDTTGARGFWIQDVAGDGNVATSDAVFVFTGVAPTVTVGQLVQVEGNVTEFVGNDANNLTTTEIDAPIITVVGTGSVAPTVLGAGGRLAPTSVIDDDNNTTYDPTTDGLDFYESLEGMLVTVPNAQAVAASNGNSTWVVADLGANATGLNSRGGVTISANDFNPERMQLFFDSGVAPGLSGQFVGGDHLGDVTGVVSYFGGNFEIIPISVGNTVSNGPTAREVTTLTGDADHLTIGSYNVENLDVSDDPAKFAQLASDIAHNLGGPDIISLEEVQDADGSGSGTNYSGQITADALIAAIIAAGGPHYRYVEIAPTANNVSGGEPNGNIRNGFLYNPDRVTYVAGSARQITDDNPVNGDAYNNSRRPLVADFTFHGETITAISVHNFSRGGSDEQFGQHQPPEIAGDQRRTDQTTPVKLYVESLVAANPQAKVVVLGDFNGFQFETALTQLESGGALLNLTRLLPDAEQYSYNFSGDSQQLDHLFASTALLDGAQFDIVHMNSDQLVRPTDHDGLVARLFVNSAIVTKADSATVSENQIVTIDVLANDTDSNAGDTKTLVSVSNGAFGGQASIVNGKVVYVANSETIDQLKQPQFLNETLTYQVKDSHGAVSSGTVAVKINGVADAPVRNGGTGNDTLTGTALEDTINGNGGNDVINGAAGADTINGGAGNDTLTGGTGADRFIFTGVFGKDTVNDFQANDRIQLDAAQFADFAAVMSHASQVGLDTVISLDATHMITLKGVAVGSLVAGEFLFI